MRTSQTGKRNRPGSRDGFTLVELSLVCVLVAALAAMAAPAFSGFWRASQVKACAWRIATLARRARDYAICHAVRTAFQYDPEQRQFSMAVEGDAADAPGEFEPVSLASGASVKVPEVVENVDVRVEGQEAQGAWPVIFFPDGQALQTEIVLEAGNDRAFSVEIMPLTGRARVVQGNVREGH